MGGFLEVDVKRDEFGEDVLYFEGFSSEPGSEHVLICFFLDNYLWLCLQTHSYRRIDSVWCDCIHEIGLS